jgi:predicted ester cyclase
MSRTSLPPNHLGRRALATGAIAAAFLVLTAGAADAAYTAQVRDGTLKIAGDAASDRLALRLQPGAPGVLDVDVGADGSAELSFDRATFTAIDVAGGGGDDEIRVDQSGGTLADESIVMNGGAGSDTLIGGVGAETLIGGTGEDVVDGNQGADVALLGDGQDRFQWDPGDGSDTVDGGPGADALDFNGSNAGESIGLAPDGDRVRLTRNVASIVMDLDGVEDVNVRLLGGADVVAVDPLAGTDAETVDVDLAAFGGGGDALADNVIVRGTAADDRLRVGQSGGQIVVDRTRVSGGEAGDDVTVETLGGADEVTANTSVRGPATVNVDGGEGPDRAIYDGSAAADTIDLVANGTEVRTSAAGAAPMDTTVEELLVRGGGGADRVASAGNLAALTALTVDGGADADVLLGGNGADRLLGGAGDDLLDGNQGADVALLGPGHDRFQWDPGDGSDTVEGALGQDALDLNASNAGELIGVAPNGARVLLTRNIGAIAMDLAGVEDLNLRTLGGSDTVTVDPLAGTEAMTVDVDLAALGGGGDALPDNVIVRGTEADDRLRVAQAGGQIVVDRTRVTGGEAGDDVTVATLGGADEVTSDVSVSGPAAINVDGGLGPDRAIYDGGPSPDPIDVIANGTEVRTTRAGAAAFDTMTEELVVRGHGGADRIAGVGNLAALAALTLDGGADADHLMGGNGADRLLGGVGDDRVDGNQGADVALLGTGDDRFQWDPGDGSDTVDGAVGADALDFDASNAGEIIGLSPDAGHVRFTRNIGAIAMDLDNVEDVNVRALGGSDAITVESLAGTDARTVDVDLAANAGGGDAQPDTVVVRGTQAADAVSVTRSGDEVLASGLAAQTRIAGSEGVNDTLRIETLGGDDAVSVAPGAELLITPVIDLGADG